MTSTAVQQTSVSALASLPNITERQQAVLRVIDTAGPICNKAIAQQLGVPVNEVTGRVFELRQKGQVIESHKDVWQGTGKTVIWWKTAA